jgi:hypothetical protein
MDLEFRPTIPPEDVIRTLRRQGTARISLASSISCVLMLKEFGSPLLAIPPCPRTDSIEPWAGSRPVNTLQTAMRFSNCPSPIATTE